MAVLLRWDELKRLDTKLSDLLKVFVDYLTVNNYSRYTRINYERTIQGFIDWMEQQGLPATRQSFTPDVVRPYIAVLAERGLKPNSRAGHVRILKAFAGWLEREGYTDQHQLAKLKLPKVPKLVVRTLTMEEKAALYKVLNNKKSSIAARNLAIISLLLDCGLRVGEVCSLRLGDVDLNSRRLVVRGKGNKERVLHLGNGATYALRRYLTFRLSKVKEEDEAPLFLSIGGRGKDGQSLAGRPLQVHGVEYMLKGLAKKAGIKRRIHPHLLRHTFATDYLRLPGTNLFDLQESLGHTTLEMTRHYVEQASMVEKRQRQSPLDAFLREMLA